MLLSLSRTHARSLPQVFSCSCIRSFPAVISKFFLLFYLFCLLLFPLPLPSALISYSLCVRVWESGKKDTPSNRHESVEIGKSDNPSNLHTLMQALRYRHRHRHTNTDTDTDTDTDTHAHTHAPSDIYFRCFSTHTRSLARTHARTHTQNTPSGERHPFGPR